MASAVSFTPGSEPQPRPRATPLGVASFAGLPHGMITAEPKYELPDTAGFYLQDALVDKPGIIRQRGPVSQVASMVAFTNPIVGLVSCYDPSGTFQVAALEQVNATTAFLSVLSSNFASKTQIPLPSGLSSSPYALVSTSQRLQGGVFIGVSPDYGEHTTKPTNGNFSQEMLVWRGANKLKYTTGTATWNTLSQVVTGTGTLWTTNAAPGMFLYSNTGLFVGTVKTVTDDTHLVLENFPLGPQSPAAGYSLVPIRPFFAMNSTGEITCSTSSAAVTGAGTLFFDITPFGTETSLYRASDGAYIGNVLAVNSNTSITLRAAAAISMSNDRFFAAPADGSGGISIPGQSGTECFYMTPGVNGSISAAPYCPVGFLSANYASRQWFANRNQPGQSSRLWFSDTINPESVNVHQSDGDYIDVSSGTSKSVQSPIKGLMPGFNSLLVCKEDETFAVTGTDPDTDLSVHKVWDDGTLCNMSMATWKDIVVWAGRNGIYSWDGTQVTDLTQGTLGREYHKAVANFDTTTYRMWAVVMRDHYLLFVENVSPAFGVTKNTTTTTPTRWTVCINLNTGALSMLTNLDIRGSVQLPSAATSSNFYAINTSGGGVICDGDALFDSTGLDGFTCTGNAAGPAFFMESKRYPLGDPLRRKLLKQIALEYQSSGTLSIDTLVDIDAVNAASTNSTSFLSTGGAWGKQRYKFLKHNNFLGFRIYPTAGTASTVLIGPWQFGFKVQSPGRI